MSGCALDLVNEYAGHRLGHASKRQGLKSQTTVQ